MRLRLGSPIILPCLVLLYFFFALPLCLFCLICRAFNLFFHWLDGGATARCLASAQPETRFLYCEFDFFFDWAWTLFIFLCYSTLLWRGVIFRRPFYMVRFLGTVVRIFFPAYCTL